MDFQNNCNTCAVYALPLLLQDSVIGVKNNLTYLLWVSDNQDITARLLNDSKYPTKCGNNLGGIVYPNFEYDASYDPPVS